MKLGKGHQPYLEVLQLLSSRTSMGAGAASTSTYYVPGTKLGSLPELILLAQQLCQVLYPFRRKQVQLSHSSSHTARNRQSRDSIRGLSRGHALATTIFLTATHASPLHSNPTAHTARSGLQGTPSPGQRVNKGESDMASTKE